MLTKTLSSGAGLAADAALPEVATEEDLDGWTVSAVALEIADDDEAELLFPDTTSDVEIGSEATAGWTSGVTKMLFSLACFFMCW